MDVRVSSFRTYPSAALTLGLVLGAAQNVRAEAPELAPAPLATPTHEAQWELAGKATYTAPPVRGGTTPFGAGFGGRFGFSLAGVYLGASVVDYLGSTDIDAWAHAVLYGGELGYALRSRESNGVSFGVRPQVGVGGLTIFHTTPSTSTTSGSTSGTVRARTDVDVVTTASGGTSGSSSGSSASNTTTTTVSNVYVQPGVTVFVSSRSTFAGVNANVLVIPGVTYGDNAPTTWMSYGIEGQLGVRF